jgi:hypothetical protein
MGTSSARQAPTGRLWRLAKAAATRYLSPANAGALEARELAARYIAALGAEGEPGLTGALAAFRLTRKVAQNLGAFYCQAGSGGWPQALAAWGLTDLPEASPALAQSLGTALGAAGGGLEQAVAHTALAGVWLDLPAPGTGPKPKAGTVVRRFLAAAFHLRLALDLGESMEAAAAGFSPLRQAIQDIAEQVGLAAETAQPETAVPLLPQHWLGLPGWTWVTQMLSGLLAQLSDQGQIKKSAE